MQASTSRCQLASGRHPTRGSPVCSHTRTPPTRSTQLHSVSQEAAAATTTNSTQQPQTAASPAELHPDATQQCVQCLAGLGFSDLDAGIYIQRAFGWGAKARSYWRHEKRDEAPDLAQVQAVLSFLESLGMDQAQVAKTIKAFPEVLGCDVPKQLQGNVAKLEAEWKLQGDVLRGAVLRNPALLGYNVDCLGDCAGECNRCWVRF